MAAIPVTLSGRLFDKKNKTEQQVTFIGLASLTGLGVGGGPIVNPEPPPDIKPEPPLVIWGGPFDPPHPAHPIVIPEPPPVEIPQPPVAPPHEGWNYSFAKNGWYYLHVPGEGEAEPKRR